MLERRAKAGLGAARGGFEFKAGVIVSYKVGNKSIRNAARALVKSSKKSYARLSRLEEGYVPYVVQWTLEGANSSG